MINDPLFTHLTWLRAPYCEPPATELEGSGVIILAEFSCGQS